MGRIKVGIIGGTGLDNPDILTQRSEKSVVTPYGKPSDSLIIGKIGSVDCILLSRHNRNHGVSPSNINYRANVYALWKEGCTHLIVTTACGSLQEHIHPGDVVIPDQFIDRTYKRESSFYDGQEGHLKGVCHIAMANPFCKELRELIAETVTSLGICCHPKGTVVTVEGPRFSTQAESHMFRQWKGDIINMTSVPEVPLANELGLLYAAIALPTDYDCWRDDGEHVDIAVIMKTLQQNTDNGVKILLEVIPKLTTVDWEPLINTYKMKAKLSVL